MSLPLRARAVIIDLDGTLLDTAADLAATANAIRAEFGMSPLAVEVVATYVGKGAAVLMHRALTADLAGRVDDATHARAMQAFERIYAVENGRTAQPYPGAREGLEAMAAKGLRLACVTNKPQVFADDLLARTGFADCFELVLGGDALARKKPDPLPMLHVAERFGVAPAEVVAIGDSVNDALAARAAGMHVLAVPYGYNEGRDVASLDVDGIVGSLHEAAMRIECAAAARSA